jgi:hypothetical protein
MIQNTELITFHLSFKGKISPSYAENYPKEEQEIKTRLSQ